MGPYTHVWLVDQHTCIEHVSMTLNQKLDLDLFNFTSLCCILNFPWIYFANSMSLWLLWWLPIVTTIFLMYFNCVYNHIYKDCPTNLDWCSSPLIIQMAVPYIYIYIYIYGTAIWMIEGDEHQSRLVGQFFIYIYMGLPFEWLKAMNISPDWLGNFNENLAGSIDWVSVRIRW